MHAASCQHAWELARLRAGERADVIARQTGSAATISHIAETAAGPKAYDTIRGLIDNPNCDAQTLDRFAHRHPVFQHRNCRPETQLEMLAHIGRAHPAAVTHVSRTVLEQLADRYCWRMVSSKADGLAAAMHANDNMHTGANRKLAAWLGERTTSAQQALGVSDIMLISNRSDLTDGEKMEFLRRLARQRPDVAPLFAEATTLPAAALADMLAWHRYGIWRLIALRQLCRQDEEGGQIIVDALARNTDDIDTLEEVVEQAGNTPANREALRQASAQLGRLLDNPLATPTSDMLQRRVADSHLRQLNEQQLALFVQLAPRHTGNFGDLLDLIARL